MYQQLSLQGGQDQGSLHVRDRPPRSCSRSTQAPDYVNWTLDQLDQTNTGQHAILTVVNDVDSNIQQIFMARIIANTATTSGGTSGNSTTVTLDQPLPGDQLQQLPALRALAGRQRGLSAVPGHATSSSPTRCSSISPTRSRSRSRTTRPPS